MKKLFFSTVSAAALYADSGELEALKAQLSQMQQAMKAMEAKIESLERTKPDLHDHETASDEHASCEHNGGHPHHVSSSPLDLSLIVDGSYANRSEKDETLSHLGIPGLVHTLYGGDGHEGHGHAGYNGQNGFNLNYAEVILHSQITADVEAKGLLHFFEGGVEIEEAFLATGNLPGGFGLKGGKFLSDFGYLNRQHHHEWDFSDLPLVYETFFGSHGINEIGAQLQWKAPVPQSLVLGLEVLQGSNELTFGRGAIIDSSGTLLAPSVSRPSLMLGYAKTGGSFGDTQYRAGLSLGRGTTRQNHLAEGEAALHGTTDLYGADLVVRHNLGEERSLTWQSEWIRRDTEGTQFEDSGSSIDPAHLDRRQSGLYTQLVYAHDDHWRGGVRYDAIYENRITLGGAGENLPENLEQYTAMVEYNDNHIARYRLQYNRTNALFDNVSMARHGIDSLIFSVNFTLGHHVDRPF